MYFLHLWIVVVRVQLANPRRDSLSDAFWCSKSNVTLSVRGAGEEESPVRM